MHDFPDESNVFPDLIVRAHLDGIVNEFRKSSEPFSQIQATVYINYLTLVYVHISFDHLTPCRAVKLNSVPSGEALTIGFHDKCMNQAS